MRIENPGYRRLYDAIECSVEDKVEHEIEFEIGNFYIQVYLGPEPRYGIDLTPKDNYGVPGSSFEIPMKHFKKASESGYARSFFTEIACWRKASSNNSLPPELSLVNAAEFHTTTDMVAGAIGLRFHNQLVLKLICENTVVLQGAQGIPGKRAFELIKHAPFSIVERVVICSEEVNKCLPLESSKIDAEKSKSSLLSLIWLLRAWNEEDKVSKFLALFIPVEVLLQGHSAPPVSFTELDEAIRNVIEKHATNNKEELISRFDKLLQYQNPPPSLASRFETMARHVNFDDWKEDVRAFKVFNRMRNGLVHCGDQSVRFHTTASEVDKNKVQQLQDLTERYVNWALFKDHEIYKVIANRVGYHKSRIRL